MRQDYKDENNHPIGWSEDYGDNIRYFTWAYGCIGIYYKSSKQYVRFKAIPGRGTPFAGADYGESDIRYWGK